MPLLETMTRLLGPAIARTILDSWLENSQLADEVGNEITDYLKEAVLEEDEKRRAQHGIEQIGEQIVAQLTIVLDEDIPGINSDNRRSVGHAFANTLRRVTVTSELIMSYNLDPSQLAQHFDEAYPEANEMLNVQEQALYQRVLLEASREIIKISPRLETFMQTSTDEVLNRLDQTASTLKKQREKMQREIDRFEGKYRNAIMQELDRVELFGLPHMGHLTGRKSVDSATITLLATRRGGKQQDTLCSRPIPEFLAQHKRVIIRGIAGSGKTTLLQWLAMHAASQDFAPPLDYMNDAMPFFIRLRARVNRGFPRPIEFVEFVDSGTYINLMPQEWVKQKLESGNALVLIDGVDELPMKQREQFLHDVTRLVADFPNPRYIITSRPTGLRDKHGDEWVMFSEWVEQAGFVTLTLDSMDTANIKQCITHWHEARAVSEQDEQRAGDVAQVAETLQQLIDHRPELRQMVTTPLFCAMVCVLHRDRGDMLPITRLQLYRECIDLMLGQRNQGYHIQLDDTYPAGLSNEQKLEAIQSFALWMMQNGYTDVKVEKVDAHFERLLPQLRLPDAVTGDQIRAFFVERTGMLSEPVAGRIDFMHRTFQEYLAAQEALDEGSLGVLLLHANEDRWREVIIVAAGLARPREREELLQELIEQGDESPERRRYLHLLAVACMETAVRLDPEINDAVLERVRLLLPPKDEDEVVLIGKPGDPIVPLLAYNPDYSPEDAARCIEALAEIGTPAAMHTLAGYAQQAHVHVQIAIALGTAWDSFDRTQYAQTVLSKNTMVVIPKLVSWEGFDELRHVTSLCVYDVAVNDLAPLATMTNLTVLEVGHAPALDLAPLRQLPNLKMSIRSAPNVLERWRALGGAVEAEAHNE